MRTLWSVFRRAVHETNEIYCVGYSIPKTDLTMRLFLAAATANGGKNIYIVNSATGTVRDQLLNDYSQVFAGCRINEHYLGVPNAVEKMVSDLVGVV